MSRYSLIRYTINPTKQRITNQRITNLKATDSHINRYFCALIFQKQNSFCTTKL